MIFCKCKTYALTKIDDFFWYAYKFWVLLSHIFHRNSTQSKNIKQSTPTHWLYILSGMVVYSKFYLMIIWQKELRAIFHLKSAPRLTKNYHLYLFYLNDQYTLHSQNETIHTNTSRFDRFFDQVLSSSNNEI